jgi:hypothetical protein
MPFRSFVTVEVGYQQDESQALTHLRELNRRSAEHYGAGGTKEQASVQLGRYNIHTGLKEDRGRAKSACQRYTKATMKNGTLVGSCSATAPAMAMRGQQPDK